jgi:hypothetical protein
MRAIFRGPPVGIGSASNATMRSVTKTARCPAVHSWQGNESTSFADFSPRRRRFAAASFASCSQMLYAITWWL